MTAASSASFRSLRSAWSTLAGFVYPEVCQICQAERADPADGLVGATCRANVQFIREPFCERCGLPFPGEITGPFTCANCRELDLHFRSARSAVAARGVVLEVVHHFKYSGHRWYEPFLAGLLVTAAGPVLTADRPDLIVPVPLHPLKQREREFNQAECLAQRLGRAVGVPVNAGLLRRVAPTQTQTRLTRGERQANVRNAFAASPGLDLTGRRVVVVDDVFTTGATTDACARLLRDAGAAEVCVWTVARGLLQ